MIDHDLKFAELVKNLEQVFEDKEVIINMQFLWELYETMLCFIKITI